MAITNFLSLDDHRADDLIPILERAVGLADRWRARDMPRRLEGMRIALVRDDGGWRNTTAFDLGIQAMGGICIQTPVSLQGGEAVADLGRYLDNWFDIVVVRTPNFDRLRELAEATRAPVINARTRSNHPCETLGDLAYVLHTRGSIEGLKVAVVAPDDNILGSWAEAAAVLPIEVVQIYPERWRADRFEGVSGFSTTTDIGALTGADVVITDCWPKHAAPEEVIAYQISAARLAQLASGALFIPCPPVTRGQEVTADAMDAPACCVIDAKAYLLHAQNALLETIASQL